MNDSSDSIFDYESSGLIGQGSFGKVYRAHHKRTGKLVAVKALPMNRTDRDRHAVLKEITILEQLKRSNYVAKYLAHYEYNNIIFIVMEYCSGGSCEIVSHLHGGLSESCIAIICRDVLRGIVELHSQGIVHRDIKGANIVLTAQGQAKLTDFGVASRATVNCDVAGTPFWMPPEMLKGRELDTLTTTLGIPHGSEVDIWSLGITVLELAHARAPLMNHALRNAMVMIPEIDPPHVSPEAGFSIEFKAFVAACLKVDPKKRATASELLQMKFIKQVSGKRDLRKLVEATERMKNPIVRKSFGGVGELMEGFNRGIGALRSKRSKSSYQKLNNDPLSSGSPSSSPGTFPSITSPSQMATQSPPTPSHSPDKLPPRRRLPEVLARTPGSSPTQRDPSHTSKLYRVSSLMAPRGWMDRHHRDLCGGRNRAYSHNSKQVTSQTFYDKDIPHYPDLEIMLTDESEAASPISPLISNSTNTPGPKQRRGFATRTVVDRIASGLHRKH